MQQTLTTVIETLTHTVTIDTGSSAIPLMAVGAYAGTALVLYGLTGGKEFLFAVVSSVLFLAPFVHVS